MEYKGTWLYKIFWSYYEIQPIFRPYVLIEVGLLIIRYCDYLKIKVSNSVRRPAIIKEFVRWFVSM